MKEKICSEEIIRSCYYCSDEEEGMSDSEDSVDCDYHPKLKKRQLDEKSESHSENKKLKQYEKKLLVKKRKEENSIRRLDKQKRVGAKIHKHVVKDAGDHSTTLISKVNANSDISVSDVNDKSIAESKKNRTYTVSIAVAGSIIDNAQSPALKAYLAGQVARAASIFNIDEIIVFDDTGGHSKGACEQMARILQFLECPQYLRKTLFPLHTDLKFAGVISPLDAPHHLRRDEALPYRSVVNFQINCPCQDIICDDAYCMAICEIMLTFLSLIF